MQYMAKSIEYEWTIVFFTQVDCHCPTVKVHPDLSQ